LLLDFFTFALYFKTLIGLCKKSSSGHSGHKWSPFLQPSARRRFTLRDHEYGG